MKIKINFNPAFDKLMSDAGLTLSEDNEIIQKDKENIEKVVEAASKTSEDVHGGDEATKDIKHSKNAADGGLDKKNNDSSAGGGGIDGDSDKEPPTADEVSDMLSPKPLVFDGTNMSEMFIALVKQLVKKHQGNTKATKGVKYDTKKIAKHLVSGKRHLVLNDTYQNTPKKVLLFLDNSGSTRKCHSEMIDGIGMIKKAGFEPVICDAGNGLAEVDMMNDKYHCLQKLNRISAESGAKIADIPRPSLETAIKMAKNAEISIILSDYDGLSDFVKLSMELPDNKIPYFFSMEDRKEYYYTPWEHSYVEEDFCEYPQHKFFNLGYIEDYEDDYYDDED